MELHLLHLLNNLCICIVTCSPFLMTPCMIFLYVVMSLNLSRLELLLIELLDLAVYKQVHRRQGAFTCILSCLILNRLKQSKGDMEILSTMKRKVKIF